MFSMTQPRSFRFALLPALLVALALPLAACGKKGDPTLPPGVTDQYPRKMPGPNSDLPPDQQPPSQSQPSSTQPSTTQP
jgi:hypothetical protein